MNGPTDLAAWAAAAPSIVAAIAWAVLPGLLVTYAMGMRGITAWGIAPVVSVGSAAMAAVAAEAVGVPWSLGVALLPALVLAVVAGVVLATGRSPRPAPPSDGPVAAVAAACGATAAAVLGLITVLQGIGVPSRLSQTYDAVFHYSAVSRILADGTASSLTLGTLTTPTADAAFYPAAWHDLVSLVVLTAGGSIPVATTSVVAVVTCVVWPLTCTALVRVVCGPAPAALAIAPVVAVGFVAFPWSLLSFGVLWPNLLGLSLVPAALAVVVRLCGLGSRTAMGAVGAVALLPVVLVALGTAHPNSLFSLGVLALFPALWGVGRLLAGQLRSGRRVLPAVAAVAVVAGLVAMAGFLLTSPVFDDLRTFDWPAYQTPWGAVVEIVAAATNDREDAWALGIAVLVGLVAACCTADRRWLVPAHLASSTLFVLASSLETDLAAAVTAFWYNDSYRLAAVIPITAVPLAVVGITGIGTLVDSRWPTGWGRPRGAVAALVAAGIVVATSGGLYVQSHAEVVAVAYPAPDAPTDLLSTGEAAFFAEIDDLIDPEAVVAQNPWSGSALLWPLTGREVLFPHLTGSWTDDQLVLAQRFRDAAFDPQVCAVANRLQVRYLLVGTPDFWLGDTRANGFPGLTAPDDGFELLADDGAGNALYELTACGPGGSTPTIGASR